MATTATTTKQSESSAAIDSRNIRAQLESCAAQLDDMRNVLALISSFTNGAGLPPPPVPFAIPASYSVERLASSITALSSELAGQARSIYSQWAARRSATAVMS